jgi:ABC-type uncharacterized transport system auxiliary subunit
MKHLGTDSAVRVRREEWVFRGALTAAVLLLVAVLGGCGAARPVQYYTIDLPERAGNPDGQEPWPVVLVVGYISTSHLYRDDRLIYRTGANELNTYEYRRWVEPPGEIIQHALLRLLRRSGRFQAVQSQRSSGVRGDYILRGRLENFEELTGPPEAGRIRLELELYEVKAAKTVWSLAYAQDEPVQGKGVDAVVQALNRNVDRALEQVTAGLEQYFTSHPPR